MKKAIVLLFLFGIAVFGIWFFSQNTGNGYDLGQSGDGSVKGGFVPEQTTDYIFITTTTETNRFLIGMIIVLLTLIFIFRNNLKKALK